MEYRIVCVTGNSSDVFFYFRDVIKYRIQTVKNDVCELDVMTKHDFTLFLFFSAVASATFSDEQEFSESESCNEREFDKSHFYSNVKYCGEIPLTLSHKLIGKIQI